MATTAETVKLDEDDPKAQEARAAEQAAYDHYGLDPTEHYIEIEELADGFKSFEIQDISLDENWEVYDQWMSVFAINPILY